MVIRDQTKIKADATDEELAPYIEQIPNQALNFGNEGTLNKPTLDIRSNDYKKISKAKNI